jgi:hypothetical protein
MLPVRYGSGYIHILQANAKLFYFLFVIVFIYLFFLKQLVRYSNVDDHELIIVIRHTVDEDW